MATTQHLGGCHCGAVRFAVDLDLANGATRCNCTACTKTAATSVIVKPEAFSLRSPEADLGTYAWGGKTGTRFFCKGCGVHCFLRGHLPELGGDYVSVNINTLDDIDPWTLKILYWDGRHNNWHAGPRETPWPVHAAS